MADRNASVMAWQLARAMSFGAEVVVSLRSRPPRKVRGRVVRREQDGRSPAKLRAGESNVVVEIAGERIAVDRMASVGLVRVGSEE